MVKTKDEINAQKGKLNQQLALDGLDKSSPKSNPKIVYLTLLIIITLSSLFWLYSSLKTNLSNKKFFFNFPSINLPQVKSAPFDPDKLINKSLDLKNGLWSFYIYANNFNYQKNTDQFDLPLSDLKDSLNDLPKSSSNYFSQYLPQSLDIKEHIIEENNIFFIKLLITTPRDSQIYIFIKNSSSSNLAQVKEQLTQFLPELYWQLIKVN